MAKITNIPEGLTYKKATKGKRYFDDVLHALIFPFPSGPVKDAVTSSVSTVKMPKIPQKRVR